MTKNQTYLRLAFLCLFITLILNHLTLNAQINTPVGATMPFGSNTSYSGGIIPTNLPTAGTYAQAQDAADAYNTWKSNYVESCGGTPERFRVKFDSPSETVSEGIAYGMLLAAYAADKALFDGLWDYYKNYMNGNGVMNWKINGCNSATNFGGATDAELDAAMALLVANHQWPNSTNPHNYESDATDLINAVKDHEIQPTTATGPYQTNNGDGWGFGNNCRNPSYQSPAYYKVFGEFLTDQTTFWDNCTDASYTLLNANAHATTGLVSNWSDPNGNSNSCNGADEFGWDACRNPWRMGTDVAWYSDTDATALCNKMAAWMEGVGASNLKGPLPQNGTGGSYHSPAFISTWAVSLMGANSSYQSLLNDMYSETVATQDSPPYYFGNTLRVISLFNLTGNFWNPFNDDDSNNTPIAVVSADPILGNAPLLVNFDGSGSTDADGDVLTYSWDFGDGNNSTDAITDNTFNDPGVYTVTLTVDDGNGGTGTETITVTVIDATPQPPTADLVATPTNGGVPLTVAFDASGSTDPNGDILTYSWDFGDGNLGTDANTNHTYTAIGTYTATLTVDDGNGGTDTETVVITATNTAPTASFTATPTFGQPPLDVSFDASASNDANGDALTYLWDFGDGNSGTGVTTSHSYPIEGIYTVTLTVDDGNGGTDTFSTTVTVSSTTCGLTLKYRTFDTTTDGATDNQVRPHFIVENTGTTTVNLNEITIRYWYTKEGTQSQNVWIDYAQIGSNKITTNFVEMASPVTGADHYLEVGFTSNAGSISPSENSGQVQTRFAKTNWSNYDETDDHSYNMSASDFQTWDKVTVYCNGVLAWGTEPDGSTGGGGNNAPVASATANPISGTAPLVVAFDGSDSSDTDGDDLTYSWDFGDGSSATGSNPNHTFINVGTYTVTLTVNDGNGGTNSTTLTINVISATPTACFSTNPTSGTAPLEIAFNANCSSSPIGASLTYSWDFGDGNSGTGINPNHTYTVSGTYTATLTINDGNGNSDTESTLITVDEPNSEGGDIEIIFTVNNSWNTGYCVNVKIINNGDTPISGWTVTFDLGDNINNLWNANWSSSGNTYTASNKNWNANIAVGGSKSFGFCASYSGSISIPTNETFNGTAIDFTYVNNTGNTALPINTNVSALLQDNLLILPNVTSSTATLKYHTSHASPVHILLFDQTGKMIQTLVEQTAYKGGLGSLELVTNDLAAGHYFVQMVANDLAVVKRLVVVK